MPQGNFLQPVNRIVKKVIIGSAKIIFRISMSSASSPADRSIFTVPAILVHPGGIFHKMNLFSSFINFLKGNFVQISQLILIQYIKITGIYLPVRFYRMLARTYPAHTAHVRRHEKQHFHILLKLLDMYDPPRFPVVVPKIKKRLQKMPVHIRCKGVRKAFFFPSQRIQAWNKLEISVILLLDRKSVV